jgi:acyl carrier protein
VVVEEALVTTYDLLEEALAETAPDGAIGPALRPESSLAELGLDSLGTIRLVNRIQQRCSLQLDEEELLRVRTVGELAALVERAGAARLQGRAA